MSRFRWVRELACGGRKSSKIGSSRRLAKAIAVIVVASLGALWLSAPSASASTVAPYLWRRVAGSGPCVGNYDYYYGHYSASPASWNSGWQFSHESNPADTHYVQEYFYENGVTAYDKYTHCINSVLYYDLLPTSYAHRSLYELWLCYAASCTMVGSSTSSWSAGTVWY
jgi:hypothetical protein